MAIDARHIDVATTTAREFDQRCGVEFGGKRGIYGNAPPLLQMEVGIGVTGDELGCAGALSGRYGAALGA